MIRVFIPYTSTTMTHEFDTIADYQAVLVDCFACSISSDECLKQLWFEATDERIETLKEYHREWDNADCDEEWATKEQEETMDKILEDCYEALCD